MVEIVIKKGGQEEPFDEEKIKNAVRAASSQAGLDEAKQEELAEAVVNKILEDFGEETSVKSIELRDKILSELDIISSETAEAWRSYEVIKK